MEAIKRLELLTLWLTVRCYHQLSYIAISCSFYSELQNWVDSLPTFNKSHLLGGLSSFTIFSNTSISIPPKPKFCCLKSLYDKYLQIICIGRKCSIWTTLLSPKLSVLPLHHILEIFWMFFLPFKRTFSFLGGNKKMFSLKC